MKEKTLVDNAIVAALELLSDAKELPNQPKNKINEHALSLKTRSKALQQLNNVHRSVINSSVSKARFNGVKENISNLLK